VGAIMAKGFREGSHITRQMDIAWNDASLLNLVVRRLLSNHDVAEFARIEPVAVLNNSAAQREFFDSLMPDQMDAGKSPKTFEWILGRVQDGSRRVAPREVIHLLTEAKNAQMYMLERGEGEPPGIELISRQALREAQLPVSRIRLEQTLYAEYPELKSFISTLQDEKTEQVPQTLAAIWDVSVPEAQVTAQRLIDIGFFESRGTKNEPRYWIPFLYRPGLNLIQGSASRETVRDRGSRRGGGRWG
jgi:hypothetical protein